MVKCLPEFEYFTVFLKNKNIIFKIRRSKITDYAALNGPTLKKKLADVDKERRPTFTGLVISCIIIYQIYLSANKVQ